MEKLIKAIHNKKTSESSFSFQNSHLATVGFSEFLEKMQTAPPLISDPFLPFSSNGVDNVNLPLILPIWFTPAPYRSSWTRKPILCVIKKRKRYVGRSSKIMIESACMIASKLGVLPPPLALLMREFVGGNGGGGGGGFGDGFGWGDIDGWKRRRKTRMGVVGILLICCLGLWVVLRKEMAIDADMLLGGLGLLLFGLSVNGWRKGVKDWILGFCCCAFLWCLVSKREDFRTWVKWLGTVNKSGRRKRRVF